jgi:hypothetical protein
VGVVGTPDESLFFLQDRSCRSGSAANHQETHHHTGNCTNNLAPSVGTISCSYKKQICDGDYETFQVGSKRSTRRGAAYQPRRCSWRSRICWTRGQNNPSESTVGLGTEECGGFAGSKCSAPSCSDSAAIQS